MLTIKQITENTEEVIRGLEKKHFKDAKATIEHCPRFIVLVYYRGVTA